MAWFSLHSTVSLASLFQERRASMVRLMLAQRSDASAMICFVLQYNRLKLFQSSQSVSAD
jgi:AraC-like DNA-binding protein